ncbi:right-handed parallel beta-helix repeat-containing protein [bacterium]|nr:right-handed parallel beta-helix repeat-containing protein [bacterium]
MIDALLHHLRHRFSRHSRLFSGTNRSSALLAMVIVAGTVLSTVLASPSAAAVYYVSSSSGTDSDSGLSPESAWQSITRVNDAALAPGDEVRFQRGDTWREELEVSWSGTPEAYITFGAYGSGDKPRILGSEQAADWTPVAGHPGVWRSATPLITPHVGHPASIFFGQDDGSITWGRVLSYRSVPTCGSGFSTLQQEYDWCYDDAVYVFAPADPTTRYRFVEVPQRRGSITMRSHQPQEYIVIDGLELRFGTMYGYNDGWPMNYEVRGLVIRNCRIGHIGIRGGDSAMGLVVWHSELLVENNEIHDCGRRSISYNIYTDNSSQPDGLVFENVVFAGNTLYHGYHTTGFDISHGDGRVSTLRDFAFRDNLIYDNPADDTIPPNDFTSMGLYLWTGAATFEDFTISGNVLKHLKQKGLAIGSGSGRFVNLQIYNNVLYGMNPNISDYRAQAHIAGSHENLRFANNIMHGTIDPATYVSRCLYYGGNREGVADLDNNLYYQDYPAQQIINTVFSGSYRMSDWEDYQGDTGWDAHSPAPQDPLLADPPANDFSVHPTSIAIDAGTDVGHQYSGSRPNIGL